MGLPTIKRFQRRQEYFRQVLLTICGRVVREAQAVGLLGRRVDTTLSVQFEELMPAGLDREATAAKQFAEAPALMGKVVVSGPNSGPAPTAGSAAPGRRGLRRRSAVQADRVCRSIQVK